MSPDEPRAVARVVGWSRKKVHLARRHHYYRNVWRPACGAYGGPWEVVGGAEVTCGHCRKRQAKEEAADAES